MSGSAGSPAAAAVLALGAGVATLDPDGRLLTADHRFLLLHGIHDHGDGMGVGLIGRGWPDLLHGPECRLPDDDAAAVEACWSRLLDAPSSAGHARADLRLAGGRVLELAAVAPVALPGAGTVLVVKDGTETAAGGARRLIQSGLVHELNNALGGMLANLYLATIDVGDGHAARKWIEAANLAAVELRARLRGIADAAKSCRPTEGGGS